MLNVSEAYLIKGKCFNPLETLFLVFQSQGTFELKTFEDRKFVFMLESLSDAPIEMIEEIQIHLEDHEELLSVKVQ